MTAPHTSTPGSYAVGSAENFSRRRALKLATGGAAAVGLSLVGLSPPAAAGPRTRRLTWMSGWHSPLANDIVTVTTNYGAHDTGCGLKPSEYEYYLDEPGSTEHLGLDLSAKTGDSVHSIGNGKVVFSGIAGSNWGGAASGGVIIIEHFSKNAWPFRAAYAHVYPGTKNPRTGRNFKANDLVFKGEKIATIAKSGGPEYSRGWRTYRTVFPPHLHFGTEWGTTGDFEAVWENGCAVKPTSLRSTNPESYLKRKEHLRFTGSIVGWRNSDGSVTSWKMRWAGGKLWRDWIPDAASYHRIIRSGGVDLGAQPARFLDQMPDSGQWAKR